MSRQVGALHRSNSHPANLQNPVPIIPLFAFPPPDFPVINIPSSRSSDTNSDISVFQTISQFNDPDLETPDEFADFEPYPYPDQPFKIVPAPLSTHSNQSSTTIPLNSLLCIPSHPNIYPIPF